MLAFIAPFPLRTWHRPAPISLLRNNDRQRRLRARRRYGRLGRSHGEPLDLYSAIRPAGEASDRCVGNAYGDIGRRDLLPARARRDRDIYDLPDRDRYARRRERHASR